VIMKNTKELILEASLSVFSEKGYESAATLEIAKTAGVAEMTLYRHFQTKNNLFMEAVKYALGMSRIEDTDHDINLSLADLVTALLHQKLMIISTHNKLIRMLIRESLSNTLPANLEITRIISNQVISKISQYVKIHKLNLDPESFAEMIVGLLLRYAIMEEKPDYHLLNQDEQMKYLISYIQILNI